MNTPVWSRLPGVQLAEELAVGYAARGHEIALAGGAVRDFIVGQPFKDLDLVSNASPTESRELLDSWAGNVADVPNPFGVVECRKDGLLVQVATFGAFPEEGSDTRPPRSRLARHLGFFDLTINTVAIRLPEPRIDDPYGGILDLRNRVLRTPIDPNATLGRWPAHILRVARFVAELGFKVDPALVAAMRRAAPTRAGTAEADYQLSLSRMVAGSELSTALDLLDEVNVMPHLSAGWRKRLAAAR
jgi:poly(A) polymerase